MEKKRKIDWIELLKTNRAYCYIKPNRYVHESGFRCFEVGYCTVGEDNKVKEKLVLNKVSDHIQLYNYNFKPTFHSDLMPNLDILLDGYIRIYPMDKTIYWWGSIDFVVSSAQLELLSNLKEKGE